MVCFYCSRDAAHILVHLRDPFNAGADSFSDLGRSKLDLTDLASDFVDCFSYLIGQALQFMSDAGDGAAKHSSGTFAREVVFFSRSGLPVCLRGIFNTR